jgi:hypothetical protein
MTGEEQQRQVRRAGFEPAEAEKQEEARSSREKSSAEEARVDAEQERETEEQGPLAEDSADRPRPRR